MNTLQKIIAHKHQQVAEQRSLYPVQLLERSVHFTAPVVSLKRYICRPDKTGIIAEIKKRSPSAGVINADVSVEELSVAYMQAGASALSVLTDSAFFGGCNSDLLVVRTANFCPILRKDFIVDEYQLLEARSIGADAVLLIAAVHTPNRVRELAAFARSLQLEVLLEIHDKTELGHINEYIDVVGINNRNLQDFSIGLDTSMELLSLIPDELVKISESGIDTPQQALQLKQAGADGFLIGTAFMKQTDPGKACASFITGYKQLLYADQSVRAEV